MRRNNLISTVITVVLMASTVMGTIPVSANTTIGININNELVKFDSKSGYPFADSNNRTLVPFRVALEKFGAIVSWNQDTKTAIAEKDGIKVEIPLGAKYILKNGQRIENDTEAVSKEGRTYLPIRKVMEAFGAIVDWDANTKAVIIKTSDKKEVSKLSFQSKYIAVNVNKSIDLKLTIEPSNASIEDIKWTTNDSSIVSIENGKLTGKAIGNTVVTVSSSNGKTTSINVYVWNEEKIEGTGLIQETGNFIFHYTEADISVICELTDALETNYTRITNKYVGSKVPVINIYIQPSVTEYHNDLKERKLIANNTVLSKTSVGRYSSSTNIILMASPLSPDKEHTYSQMIEVMVHEFTHYVVGMLNPNVSKVKWLSEGIASYEASQYTPQSFPQYDYIRKGQFPSITSLTEGKEYVMGSTAIDFIETKFGTASLLNLIKNNGDIQGILGLSILEFDSQWHQFVNEKYLKK